MANSVQVTLPEIGDGIESGDILDIFVSVGDVIEEGQDVVEIETDKATVPVPSTAAGKVVKILVSTGDSVPIGGPLVELETADGSDSSADGGTETEQPSASAEPEPAADEQVESTDEPEDEPAVAKQQSAPAEPADDTDEEDEDDEKPAEPPAKSSPPAAAPAAKPAQPLSSPPPPVSPPAAPGKDESVIAAGPAIRRLAREVGVELSRVTGTGDGGRITRDDVLSVVRQASQAVRSVASQATAAAKTFVSSKQAETAVSGEPPTATDDHGPIRVERMSKIRKTIAAQMHHSWSTVPRVTNFDDADVTDLERLRQSSKDDYAAQGLKLTTMPFLIKAVATSLKHHPEVNATVDLENQQVILKDYVNVGIAVDTDRGLVVPVLRDVDQMGIPEIARKLAEMAGKVRGGQFAVNELRGGTFTISNLGAIGGQYSTPIVNVPEVAILLVGRSRKLPVVMPDDSIQPRLMMPLSLSYDHRLVDGGTAARFLNDVIGYLQAPSRLLLAL